MSASRSAWMSWRAMSRERRSSNWLTAWAGAVVRVVVEEAMEGATLLRLLEEGVATVEVVAGRRK